MLGLVLHCLIDGPNSHSGKKLKKRLEDLERRAGSSSASPEQRHEELPNADSIPSISSSSSQRKSSHSSRRERTPDLLTQQYVLPSDDRGMFSQQYTRQLSTSPPPFSYASIPSAEGVSYPAYSTASYCGIPSTGAEVPLYPQYLPIQQTYGVPTMTSPPIKQEFYGDEEMNPFSMSYAAINEMPSYQGIPYVSRYQPPPSYPHHPRNHQSFPTRRG